MKEFITFLTACVVLGIAQSLVAALSMALLIFAFKGIAVTGFNQFPLRTLARIVGGGTPSKDKAAYWNGDIPWVSPKDMWVDEVVTSEDKITAEAVRLSATNLVPAKSVLCVVRSGILARKFPVAITGREVAINQDIKAIIPSKELDGRYLYYFMKASEPAILAGVTTGATVHRVATLAIAELLVPLPPLEEQRRIAAVLDEAFAAIATATANVKKNLVNADSLFSSCLETVFEIGGANWKERTLGNVCRFVGGSQPPKTVFSTANSEGMVRLIQIRDYKSDRYQVFIPEKLAKRFCAADDVMIGRYGPPLFQILRGLDGAYNVALMKADADTCVVSKDFLYFFMRNAKLLRHVIAASDRAAGQIGLTKETLEPYPISFPDLAEQEAVVDRLTGIEAETIALKAAAAAKLRALIELRQCVLNIAFSGKLDMARLETLAA